MFRQVGPITWQISTGRRKKVLLALVTALPAPRKRVLRFRDPSPWLLDLLGIRKSPCAVASIVEAYMAVGINEISLSDASGMAFPPQVQEICAYMKKHYPKNMWWLHFHNTRGLGMANILAGMQSGFTQFDSSFAGVGGCPFVPGAAGNVATEDVLNLCEESGIDTGIDFDKALEVSRRVAQLVAHPTDSYLLRAGKSRDLFREIPTGQGKNETMK